MDNPSLKELLEKYNTGVCSSEEKQLLESWYLAEANVENDIVDAAHLAQANDDIWQKVLNNTDLQKADNKVYWLWPRVVGIAAALIFITIGIYFFTRPLATPVVDIAPGSNKATLTLANGKKIELSNNKWGVAIDVSGIKYNDGSEVDSSFMVSSGPASPSDLIARTPRGGTYQLVLADGTRVWLNASSSLSFPPKFSGKTRLVTLTGEAYFEVSKDKVHPFIVKSKGHNVEVLGTHFNINCYADETVVKTTLLEGSVIVNDKTILIPGEQSIWDGEGLKVSQADLEADLSWKNGDFIFNGERLESIMRKVSRWYDVEVIYEVGAPKDFVLGGFVSRSKPISAILELMEKTGKINYKINGRTIIITP